MVTKDLPDGTQRKALQATASSTIKDRHGDEFTTPCVQKMASSAKESGMTIFLNHKYAVPEDIFGKTTDATSVIRAEGADVFTDLDLEMEVNETNPRSVATLAALEGGAKLGVSVGCLINEWHPRDPKDTWGWDGMIIDDVELLEASIVGIPANPRSWVKAATKALKSLAAGPTEDDETNDTLALLDSVVEVAQAPAPIFNIYNGIPLAAQKTSGEPDPAVTPAPEAEPAATTPDAGETPVATTDQPAETQPTDDGAGTEEAAEGAPEPPETAPSPDAISQQTATTLEAAITQINAFASERTAWMTERFQLIKERDEAREGLKIASQIVEKIATLPLGRKTAFAKAASDFQTQLAGVYDEDFLKFLERKPDA